LQLSWANLATPPPPSPHASSCCSWI
jgi:hypothetical protein